MELLIIISIVIAFLIAHFLGRKRQIGFGWALFFCIFLGPFIGFIITMLSRKNHEEEPIPSKAKKVIGWILAVLFSLILAAGLFVTIVGPATGKDFKLLIMVMGFVGLGYYLIELGKGKSFNNEVL